MYHLTVHYCPEDNEIEKVADGVAARYVQSTVDNVNLGNYVILMTSQALVVDYVRLAVAEGRIHHKKVQFRFENYEIDIDKCGRLSHWPKGFCDYTDNILTSLLELEIEAV